MRLKDRAMPNLPRLRQAHGQKRAPCQKHVSTSDRQKIKRGATRTGEKIGRISEREGERDCKEGGAQEEIRARGTS